MTCPVPAFGQVNLYLRLADAIVVLVHFALFALIADGHYLQRHILCDGDGLRVELACGTVARAGAVGGVVDGGSLTFAGECYGLACIELCAAMQWEL